jgi:transcriptional regulator with XRE-family HTH domain
MRAKSPQRLLAEKLRCEQGLSYREIATRLKINKSTLSGWLKAIALTPGQEDRLQKRLRDNRASFAARALPINRLRYQQAREQAYQSGVDVVYKLPTSPLVDELAFALLYLGEGTKGRGKVEVASMDANILRFVCWTLRYTYHIDETRLSFRLNLVGSARPREKSLIKWWSRALDGVSSQFLKTQFDVRSRPRPVTKDYRGVCTVTYSDTYLQQHILGLASAYLQTRQGTKKPSRHLDGLWAV